MTEGMEGIFARTEEFPNSSAQARSRALVGLDDLVSRLVNDAVILTDPTRLHTWSAGRLGVRALIRETGPVAERARVREVSMMTRQNAWCESCAGAPGRW